MVCHRDVSVFLLCTMAFGCTLAHAETHILPADARGWAKDNGSIHGGDTDSNYIVGNNTVGQTTAEYRNWFSFDLSLVSEEILSATVRIDTEWVVFNQSPSTVIYDIASYDFLSNFDTMGNGDLYGQHEYSQADAYTTVQISLNEIAVNAMNNASSFGMSGRMSAGADFGGGYADQFIMGGTHLGGNVQLVVTTVPNTGALVPLSLSLLPVVRRRRR